jgi:hypothetical protein
MMNPYLVETFVKTTDLKKKNVKIIQNSSSHCDCLQKMNNDEYKIHNKKLQQIYKTNVSI